METAMVWNNSQSFKNCWEGVRMLRQSQHSDPEVMIALLGSMPALHVIPSVREMRESRRFIGGQGWLTLVPVERIALPRSSQN